MVTHNVGRGTVGASKSSTTKAVGGTASTMHITPGPKIVLPPGSTTTTTGTPGGSNVIATPPVIYANQGGGTTAIIMPPYLHTTLGSGTQGDAQTAATNTPVGATGYDLAEQSASGAFQSCSFCTQVSSFLQENPMVLVLGAIVIVAVVLIALS